VRLASVTAESEDLAAAQRYAESFIANRPADPRGAELLGRLRKRGDVRHRNRQLPIGTYSPDGAVLRSRRYSTIAPNW
jgi:hypothetical protein